MQFYLLMIIYTSKYVPSNTGHRDAPVSSYYEDPPPLARQ